MTTLISFIRILLLSFFLFQIKDSVARDEWVKERSQSINKVREAERNADNVARSIANEKKLWVNYILNYFLFSVCDLYILNKDELRPFLLLS